MSETQPTIQMWACYVGEDNQPMIDSLRKTLLDQENIRLKSFATKVIGGIETVGTESDGQLSVIDGEAGDNIEPVGAGNPDDSPVRYELTNGQAIHELTNAIVGAKAVGVFLSPGFLASKYCCLELAGLLRRDQSHFPGFFIHCSGVDIQEQDYRDQLAKAIAEFVEAEGHYLIGGAEKFKRKPEGSNWVQWFESLLDQRTDGIIHCYGKTTAEVCSDIVGYRDESVLPELNLCHVEKLYSRWIDSIERENLRNYLDGDAELREGQSNHRVLAADVFTSGALNNPSIGWMVQRLGSYLEDQMTSLSKSRARDEIRSISGFLALTLLEPTWIASLVEKTTESVILHFPVKYRSGSPDPMASLYSAVAIGMVNGRVPVLKLADGATHGIKGVSGHGGIRLNDLPAVPDSNRVAEDLKVEQLLREFYKEAFNVPAVDVPQPLEDHDLIELQGKLTGYIADGKSICYIELDLGTFRQFTDWSVVINKTLGRLNQHGDESVKMPFVMIKRGTDAAFILNPDAGRRFEPLRQLIDLCEVSD